MSHSWKLGLLIAGIAGAWFAATREADVPLTQRSVHQRVERPTPPEEQGALTPEEWRATPLPEPDEDEES